MTVTWYVIVQQVTLQDDDGVVRMKLKKRLGGLPIVTNTKQREVELLYTLTAPNSAFYNLLKSEEDGWYRIVVLKPTPSSAERKHPIYGFWGYALLRKVKDILFFETKYFNIGTLNSMLLQTRDPQEEVKRGHWKDIPGGEVDYAW